MNIVQYYAAVSDSRKLYVFAESTFNVSQILDAVRMQDEIFTIMIADKMPQVRLTMIAPNVYEEEA